MSFIRLLQPLCCLGALLAPLCVQAADTLSLPDAARLAVERSQSRVALDAQSRAAREMGVAAGQLPDPVLKFGLNNFPVTREMAGSLVQEGMTMRSVGLMQEITRGEKREARTQRAEREAELMGAMRRQVAIEVQREAASAWLDVSATEAMRALLDGQIIEANLQTQAAESAFRAARGDQAELIAARSNVERLRDQRLQMDRDIALARLQLTRWVGEPAQAVLAARPDITQLSWSPQTLESDLAQHAALQVSAQQRALAEADAEVARANRKSDWSVELMYGQRGPSFSNVVSLNFSVPLQIAQGQRQDRELAARLAAVEQARALEEDTRRAYLADVHAALASWQSALERMKRYDASIVPLARDRVEASLASWRAGSGSLSNVLEARRMALDARMERERVSLDAARAWARLEFLKPESSY